MFHQFKFIQTNHHVPLEAVLRSHPGNTPVGLAKLYELALGRLNGSTQSEVGIACSSLVDTVQNISVGTATSEVSGTYVQLAKIGNGEPLLTVGVKWAVESQALHTTGRQIKIW